MRWATDGPAPPNYSGVGFSENPPASTSLDRARKGCARPTAGIFFGRAKSNGAPVAWVPTSRRQARRCRLTAESYTRMRCCLLGCRLRVSDDVGMAPSGLTILRESVGLTASQLAELTDYEEERVRAWEGGCVPIPLPVAEILIRLDEYLGYAVNCVLDEFRQFQTRGMPVRGEISLMVYGSDQDLWHYRPEFRPLPTTLHATLVQRCCKALAGMGIAARAVCMEPQAYEQWRHGRNDCERTRAEWATLQRVGRLGAR